MNLKIDRVSGAIIASMVLVSLWGAACDLRKPAQQPTGRPSLATRAPHWTGPSSCLVEGFGHPGSCRGGLPECEQEDGSGPGVWCFWTDPDTGDIWFNDGDETNDPKNVP